MKPKLLFSVALMSALGFGALQARTWTSADGTKTFEGEFKSYDASTEKVTVTMRNGRTVTFDIAKLADIDQTFAKEQKADGEEGGADAAAAAEFAETKMGKALRKVEILEGSSFKKHEFAKAPEFFILYFSASW